MPYTPNRASSMPRYSMSPFWDTFFSRPPAMTMPDMSAETARPARSMSHDAGLKKSFFETR